MPKRLLLAAVLLVAAALAVALLYGETRSNSRAVPAPPGIPLERDEGEAVTEHRLFGRVLEDGTDAPIAGATVTAYAFASGRVLTTTAAADGTFTLPEAPGDAFELVARQEGYGAASLRAVGLDAPITLRLPATGGISGEVVAAEGRTAVAGCRVSAARVPDPKRQDLHGAILRSLVPADLLIDATATTDAEGAFELQGLAPGHYGLLIEAQGMSPVPYRPHTGQNTGLCVVEVRAGDVEHARIRVAELVEKLAYVFDQDTGAPLYGARFEIQAPACRSAYLPMAAAERGEGAYALQAGFRGQRLRLRVSRDGYASRVVPFPTFGPLDIGPKSPIAGPAELDFQVALGRAATIDGHVRHAGKPVPGAILVITGDREYRPGTALYPHDLGDDEALATGTTGPDGAFVVPGLDPSEHLRIQVYASSLDPIAAMRLALRSGERRTVEIDAHGVTAIEGRVVVAGEPAAGAAVTLEGATEATCVAGPDGEYRFEGLSAGPHELTVGLSGDGCIKRHVEVAEGPRVRLDIDAARSIDGVVVDAQTGLPVPRVYSIGVVASGVGSKDRAFASVGEDGRFRLRVEARPYRIACSCPWFYALEHPLMDMTQPTAPEVVLRVSRTTDVTLDARDERTGEVVVDATCAYSVDGDRYRQRIGDRGRVLSIREVPPGPLRVRIWSDEHAPTEVVVVVDAA